MCGRYTIGDENVSENLQKIIESAQNESKGGADLTLRAGGDVYPTDVVPAICGAGGNPHAVKMRWGFRTERGLVINARAETALEWLLFRESAQERRCLLPSTGYYEWNGNKERFLFHRPDRSVLYMAGLYRIGADGMDEFVILTREADEKARVIHARMPLIVSSVYDWLFDRRAAEQILGADGQVHLEIERQSPQQLSLFDE